MVTRRAFLGLVGVGILAHHKPGHRRGPPTTTTSTTTTTTTMSAPTTTTIPGIGIYTDIYVDLYGAV